MFRRGRGASAVSRGISSATLGTSTLPSMSTSQPLTALAGSGPFTTTQHRDFSMPSWPEWLRSSQKAKPEPESKSSGKEETLVIPKDELKPSYKKFQQHWVKLSNKLAAMTVLSPAAAGVAALSDSMLIHSPAKAVALFAGATAVDSYIQRRRLDYFSTFSATRKPEGVSENGKAEISPYLAGTKFTMGFNRQGLEISGIPGDPAHPSGGKEKKLAHIEKDVKRIVVPDCAVGEARPYLEEVDIAWGKRFLVFKDICKIVSYSLMDPQSIRKTDKANLAGHIHEMVNATDGAVLGKARIEWREFLKASKNPKEVIEKIVDSEMRGEGALNSLEYWQEKHPGPLNVGIGFLGRIVITPQGINPYTLPGRRERPLPYPAKEPEKSSLTTLCEKVGFFSARKDETPVKEAVNKEEKTPDRPTSDIPSYGR